MATGFGWRVIKRALADTWNFVHLGQHLLVPLFLVLAGGGLDLYVRGIEAVKSEWQVFLVYTLAPLGAFSVLLFLWNLWLAPFRLLLEGNALSGTVAAPAPTPKVADWQAGSKVPKYKVWQAAQLWVNREPTTDTIADYASPIYNRLIADLESYKLPSVDKYNLGDDQTIGPHTEIHRNDLIKYAEAANEKPKFLFT